MASRIRAAWPPTAYLPRAPTRVHLDLVDTICNAVYGYDFTSAVTRMDQRLWIPNAFTPNGDGRNEVLTIAGNDCFPGDHFVILNSFGNVMFETDEPFKEFLGRKARWKARTARHLCLPL